MSDPLVCILAAGLGTRMGFADGALHKALVPLGSRAVLSHVVSSFPVDSRFVVAVGHRADQIQSYLSLAHPELDVTFVEVEPYEGPGSGPGRSLLACADLLTEPFVLTAADSILAGVPPCGGRSWLAVADVADPTAYLTLETDADRRVVAFQERTGPSRLAFTGVAWITEPETYFTGVREAAPRGELQVTPGFAAMLRAGVPIDAVPCDWIDTGTTETYAAARTRFAEEPSGGRVPVDVTYLLPDRVVKWFRDADAGERVAARAHRLGDAVPEMIPSPRGWLAYARVEGETLRDRLDGPGATALLDWAATTVWRPRSGGQVFTDACRAFYGDKTRARLAAYLAERDGVEPPSGLVINHLPTPTVAAALDRELDRLVAAARPTGFHGDLHEGNVIAGSQGLRLIDWRDDFGGLSDRGDQLYDLAKLLHTLELPESVMRARTWSVAPAGDGVELVQPDADRRRQARAAFWRWCERAGVDAHALGTLDALVFVNMAPLYDRDMGDYLYLLGRWLLEVTLRGGAMVRERAVADAFRSPGAPRDGTRTSGRTGSSPPRAT